MLQRILPNDLVVSGISSNTLGSSIFARNYYNWIRRSKQKMYANIMRNHVKFKKEKQRGRSSKSEKEAKKGKS
uniref:Putative ovule protein n=1 Tax=Solanum chacoense TaxID=4108 RepID=A0A0V0GHL1_SOLCH